MYGYSTFISPLATCPFSRCQFSYPLNRECIHDQYAIYVFLISFHHVSCSLERPRSFECIEESSHASRNVKVRSGQVMYGVITGAARHRVQLSFGLRLSITQADARMPELKIKLFLIHCNLYNIFLTASWIDRQTVGVA